MGFPVLALGSAQFGMEYGYSNGHPLIQVSHAELGRILSLAALSGTTIIDTAHAYGSAIAALGRYSKKIEKSNMGIVTKLPKIEGPINQLAIEKIRHEFITDLKKLKQENVYCLMIHSPMDLLRRGAYLLYDFLYEMKQNGFCYKIGVSVYRPSEIVEISNRYQIDLVQIPLSILDQRFNRKFLRGLKSIGGMEIHSRSLFLQGMLFADTENIDSKFGGIIRKLKLIRTTGLTPMQASLNYISQFKEIDHIVIGVHASDQLSEIILEYRTVGKAIDWKKFAVWDECQINPALW